MYINETTTNSKPVSNDKLNCFSHFQETNNDDILHLIHYYEKRMCILYMYDHVVV